MKSKILADLYTKLSGQGTTITLDKDSISNQQIIEQWKTLFKAETIKLSGATLSTPDDTGNFTTSGTSPFMKFGKLTLHVEFFVSYTKSTDDTEVLQCVIKPDKNIGLWNLKSDFPDMPGYVDYALDKIDKGFQTSFLTLIDFTGLNLGFSSYDFSKNRNSFKGDIRIAEETMEAGINFAAEIKTDQDFWGTVKQITKELGNLNVFGCVSKQGDGIGLEVGHHFDLTFSISDSLSVSLTKLIIRSGLTDGSFNPPEFAISCEIKAVDPALELEIDIGVGRKWIGISGFFKDGRVLTLNKIADKLGMSDLQLVNFLPQGFTEKYFGTLGLKDFSLEMTISPAKVEKMAFSISTEKPWTIIQNKVKVQPFFSVDIENPFDGANRKTTLEIIGKWELGKTDLYVLALPISGDVSVFMGVGQTLDVAALVKDIVPGITLPKVTFDDLKFYANYLTNTYLVQLDVETGFVFDLGFCTLGISEVGFSCYYDGKTLQNLNIEGHLNLAGINLKVNGQYNDQTKWAVSGGFQTAVQVNFKTLFNNLANDLNLSGIQIPASIPDKYCSLEISSLCIDYKSNDNSFSAYVDITHVLDISENFKIDEIAIGLDFVKGKLEKGSVKVLLTVLKIDIVLDLEKDKDMWQFTGGTGKGQKIPVGQLLTDLMHKFDCTIEVPDVISGFSIQNISISYKSESKDQEFKFSCEGIVPIGDKELDILVDIILTKDAKGYSFSLEGQFIIGKIKFIIDFELTQKLKYLVATIDPADVCTLNLHDLISDIWSEAGEIIPDSLEIKLKDVFFVLAQESDPKNSGLKMMFGVDVGADFDLSDLKVIGTLFDKGTDIGIDDLQGLVVTKPISDKLLKSVNETLSKLSGKKYKILPAKLENPGLYFTAIFKFMDFKPQIELPIVKSPSSKAGNQPALMATTNTDSTAGKIHWSSINKTIGPIQLRKIGIGLSGSDVKFGIDISLVTTGLEIDLIGLWVGINVSDPFGQFPSCGIHGLDVAYSQPPVEFNGGLLYVKDPLNKYAWEINGQLIVKYGEYGFFADGSYAQPKSDKMSSFFAFLMVSAPIGGPPYLYLSGLAGGFGFNRNLRVPQASEIQNFPLVKGALDSGDLKSGMKADAALTHMDQYVPPTEGDYWLAAGVSVGSCHIINAFVMVAGVFGTDFELSVIGLATADIPTGESPVLIAHIELALVGNFAPMRKSVEITGALTSSSYIFMPECHLTGGFAYCVWLDKGDFLVSIGGYSPAFTKPSYYPTLGRLGINWQIASNLTLKGGAFYAYTPSCAMAGGELDLNFHLSMLRAWLTAHADFLMQWLPFHYDISIGVNVGVSVTIKVWFIHKTFSLEIGADLHLWGPKFAGEAKVHLWIVSFTISFGDNPNKKPPKLEWDKFYDALLPNDGAKSNSLLTDGEQLPPTANTVSVKEGLINGVRRTGKQDYWIMSGNKFTFITHSAVPSTTAMLNTNPLSVAKFNTKFGVRPMGKSSFTSDHVVTLECQLGDGTWQPVDSSMIDKEVYGGNVPEANWSTTELNGPAAKTVDNVPVGITISSIDPEYYDLPAKGEISTKVFLAPEPILREFSWGDKHSPENPKYTEDPVEEIKLTVMSEKTVTERKDILAGLATNGFTLPGSVDLKKLAIDAENLLQAEPELYELGAI